MLCVRITERVTDSGPLTGFYGRVYRMVEGAQHFDEWHDDLDGDRRVAVSINLGRERFEGGHLLIRDYATRALLADVHNTGLGSVLMFRLGRPDVLPVLDLGVQKAIKMLYRLRSLPTPERVARIGARWAPYRTVASWYLWRRVDDPPQ